MRRGRWGFQGRGQGAGVELSPSGAPLLGVSSADSREQGGRLKGPWRKLSWATDFTRSDKIRSAHQVYCLRHQPEALTNLKHCPFSCACPPPSYLPPGFLSPALSFPLFLPSATFSEHLAHSSAPLDCGGSEPNGRGTTSALARLTLHQGVRQVAGQCMGVRGRGAS